MKRKVCLDNYTIFINPSYELGVDYSIIDSVHNCIIACNCTYCDTFSTLNDLFNHIIKLICDYEKSRRKKIVSF